MTSVSNTFSRSPNVTAYAKPQRSPTLLVAVLSVILVVQASLHVVRAAELTVWLIPFEPVISGFTGRSANDNARTHIDTFNSRLDEPDSDNAPHVTVLNTTLEALRDELFDPNVEHATLNWPAILSQETTVARLKSFSKANKVRIKVRFISWGRAFSELRRLSETGQATGGPPDVMQVGSTWVKYLLDEKLLLPQSVDSATLVWRHMPSQPRAALRYTTDIRLLFYWKRVPDGRDHSTCVIDSQTWQTTLTSLERCSAGHSIPFPMPVGLTVNLLHDILPLVVHDKGPFLSNLPFGRSRVDIASPDALRILLLFADYTTRNRQQLLSFPESTHQAVISRFLAGQYRAVSEPLAFLMRWKNSLAAAGIRDEELTTHLGVTSLPRTFMGGSDLVVSRFATDVGLASSLARFLATDEVNTHRLSELGHLPPNRSENGLPVFLSSTDTLPIDIRNEVKGVLDRALALAVEHPNHRAWPLKIEATPVLESIQRVFRRVREGNADHRADARIRPAVKELERTINRELDFVTGSLVTLEESWRLLGAFGVIGLLLAAWSYRGAAFRRRAVALALLLARAKFHGQLRDYGATIQDFTLLPPDRLKPELLEYGSQLSKEFSPHMKDVIGNVCTEVGGKGARLNLRHAVEKAFEGAEKEYHAAKAIKPPLHELLCSPELDHWEVQSMGNVLVLVLQEWIFNTYKRLPLHPTQDGPARFSVTLESRPFRCPILKIATPVKMKKLDAARITGPVSSVNQIYESQDPRKSSGQGLPLIKDLLWYAFHSRPSLEIDSVTTLCLPIRLKRGVP